IARLAELVAVQADPQVAVARLARQVVLEVAVLRDNLALLETDLHLGPGLQPGDLEAHFLQPFRRDAGRAVAQDRFLAVPAQQGPPPPALRPLAAEAEAIYHATVKPQRLDGPLQPRPGAGRGQRPDGAELLCRESTLQQLRVFRVVPGRTAEAEVDRAPRHL